MFWHPSWPCFTRSTCTKVHNQTRVACSQPCCYSKFLLPGWTRKYEDVGDGRTNGERPTGSSNARSPSWSGACRPREDTGSAISCRPGSTLRSLRLAPDYWLRVLGAQDAARDPTPATERPSMRTTLAIMSDRWAALRVRSTLGWRLVSTTTVATRRLDSSN